MRISSNEIIGLRVSRFRKELNMTQAELSEKLNVSVNEISNIERGKNNMSYATLLKLCNELDRCPCQILTGAIKESVEDNIIDIIRELDLSEREILYKMLLTYFENKL